MEAKKNFMIDTETLATTPNAVVRCISVIPFTLEREESVDEILGRQLTVWIQAQPQVEAGRALCEDTIAWWEKRLQSNDPAERAAAERIFAENADEVDPKLGLEIIAAYMLDEEPDGLIYSRGSNFDFPMFEDKLLNLSRGYGYFGIDICRRTLWTFQLLQLHLTIEVLSQRQRTFSIEQRFVSRHLFDLSWIEEWEGFNKFSLIELTAVFRSFFQSTFVD
jgi:hypothetical protein